MVQRAKQMIRCFTISQARYVPQSREWGGGRERIETKFLESYLLLTARERKHCTEIPLYKAHSSLTGTRELTGTNRNLVSWRSKGKYRRSLEHTILSENGEYMLKRLKIQLQGSPAPQILDNLSIRKIVTNFNSLNKVKIHESI